LQQHIPAVRPTSTLAEVPEADSEEESVAQQSYLAVRGAGPEIVNPKPSHRHNISVKLERDIQNSDYHLEDSINRQLDEDEEFGSREGLEARPVPPPSDKEIPARWQSAEATSADPDRVQLPQRTTSLKKSLNSPAGPTPELESATTERAVSEKQTQPTTTASLIESVALAANPWENDPTFKPKDPAPPKQTPRSNHSSKGSTLNVAAKEFSPSGNPSATFNPTIFSASAFSFQPAKARPFVPGSIHAYGSGSQSSRHSATGSISGLSASAPAFSPKGMTFSPKAPAFSPNAPAFSPTSFGSTIGVSNSNSEFSFVPQAPVFKPTAPVFKPTGQILAPPTGASTAAAETSEKIFTNLNIPDVVAPARRSKAVPIVPPNTQKEQSEDKEDEDGRITQGDFRQKRARRGGSDGDQVPQFAIPTEEARLLSVEGGLKSSATTSPEDMPRVDTDLISDAVERTGSETEVVTQAESKHTGFAENDELPTPTPIIAPEKEDRDAGLNTEHSAGSVSPASGHEKDGAAKVDVLTSTIPSHVVAGSSGLSALATPFVLKPNFELSPDLKAHTADHFSSFQSEKELHLVYSPAASQRSSSTVSKTELDNSSDRLEEDLHSGITSPHNRERLPSSVRYYDDLDQPSFQEIDAVMKHFDDEGSDAGVERDEPSWPNSSPRDGPSPNLLSRNEPDFAAKLRSDAPSPSPRRYIPSRALDAPDFDSTSITQDPFSDTRAAPNQDSPVHNLNDAGDLPVSDWDDVVSSAEDGLLRERSSFFDKRIAGLLQGALEHRLAPMEKRLQHIIEAQLARLPPPTARRVRSRATMDSDADDEDDDAETDAYSRGWSPKRDRKMDKFKVMLQEALTASQSQQQNRSPSPAKLNLSEVYQALEEIKATVSQSVSAVPQLEQLKEIVDESIARQNQALVLSREQAILAEDNERFSEFTEKFKEAAAHITAETQARKHAERREEDAQRLLKLAEEELALVKQTATDAEARLNALEEAQSHGADDEGTRAKLSKKLMAVTAENGALQETLEEYRISSDKWRHDIDHANAEKEKIHTAFGALKIQAEEAFRIRETMRSRIEKLHTDMSTAIGKVANERAKWATSDTEHRTRYEVLSARIEAEGRTRERLEQELERLETQEREAMRLRVALEQTQDENVRINKERERLEMQQREMATLKLELVQTQKDNTRLEELANALKLETEEHQKTADQYAREFREARDAGRMEVQRTRGLMELDVEAANNQVNIVRADLESEISRIRSQLESVKMDADTAKAKHELELEQAADARRDTARDASEAKNLALQEQRETFEERMEELRKQHRRDLDHVIENKNHAETFLKETHAQRLHEMQLQYERATEQATKDKEHSGFQFNELLALSNSKVDHLQDKVMLLEEKLGIAKSAAHAAAQAAQAAKSPALPAPSTALRVPEKISPQALRESIAVLQEQLQERESRIENLEHELSVVDKEAPSKIKARDTEIGWLRELLGVRMDDLADLVAALSQPNFNREAVRNAAIRIRAGLQMEQQEKERQMSGAQNFPTLASISNFASPKAAQLAAAIGNWRRSGPSGLSQSVSTLIDDSNGSSRTQTPSKAPSSTAQSFLSGLMTPPASNVRRTPEPESATQLTSLGRPLNSPGYSTSAKLSRSQEKQSARQGSDRPMTPPLLRRGSYDQDAEDAEDISTSGFYDDDGSTIDGTPRAERRMRAFEPFGSDTEHD
jgi:hypothetical protein